MFTKFILKFVSLLLILSYSLSTNKINKESFTILLLGQSDSGMSCFIDKFFEKKLTNNKELEGNKEYTYDFKYSKKVIKDVRIILGRSFMSTSENEIFYTLLETVIDLLSKKIYHVDSILLFYPLNRYYRKDTNFNEAFIKQIESIKLLLGEEYSKTLSEMLLIVTTMRQKQTSANISFLDSLNEQYAFNHLHFYSANCEDKMDDELKNNLFQFIINKGINRQNKSKLNKINLQTLTGKVNCILNNKSKYTECLKFKYNPLNKLLLILNKFFNKFKNEIYNQNVNFILITILLIFIPSFCFFIQKFKIDKNSKELDLIKTVEKEKLVEDFADFSKDELNKDKNIFEMILKEEINSKPINEINVDQNYNDEINGSVISDVSKSSTNEIAKDFEIIN